MNLSEAISLIVINKQPDEIARKFDQINEFFTVKGAFFILVQKLVILTINEKELTNRKENRWIEDVAKDEGLMKTYLSLHEAAL